MVKNPKKKGNAFERDICKRLSLWLSNGKDDNCFWRSQNSGGRYTIRKKIGKKTLDQNGDITYTNPEYKFLTQNFHIECKHYKDIGIWNIITDTNSKLKEWWEKSEEEAKILEKHPLLIARENRKPTILLMDEDISEKITKYFDLVAKVIIFWNDRFVYVYLFDDIVCIPPDMFKEMLESID